MNKEHPFDTNEKLSFAYTYSFKEPCSKWQINKKLTDSSRYQEFYDEYKEYFYWIERDDKRFGKLLQSKPEPLFNYINSKVTIYNYDQHILISLFDDKSFRTIIDHEKGIIHVKDILNLISIFAITTYMIGKFLNTINTREEPKKFNKRRKKIHKNIIRNLIPLENEFKNDVEKISPEFDNIVKYFHKLSDSALIQLMKLTNNYLIILEMMAEAYTIGKISR